MLITKTKVAYALFLFSFTIWLALFWTALSPTFTAGNQIQFTDPALLALFVGSAFTASIGCLLIGVHYLGWQEIESLQKKQAELDVSAHARDVSALEKQQNSLERMAVIMEGMKIQEEHISKLEVKLNELNDKHEAMSKLESRIAELENTLKKPVKEPAREEPEKQTTEVTVLAVPWQFT